MSKYFSLETTATYRCLKLIGPLNIASTRDFEKEVSQVVLSPLLPLIVNCESIDDLSPAWLRLLARLAKELKALDVKLRMAHVCPPLAKALQTEGLNSTLICAPTMSAALAEIGIGAPRAASISRQMDVNFVNPFLIATANVLKIQASTEVKAGRPVLKDSKEKFFGEISGVIGLVSDAFVGSVVITFPEATFLKIMSRMLGEEFTTLTPEIQDGAGELTNIIFGQAKMILNEKGYGIRTAIPSVVTGKNHSVQSIASNGPRVAIPFETDIGNFQIEICLSG